MDVGWQLRSDAIYSDAAPVAAWMYSKMFSNTEGDVGDEKGCRSVVEHILGIWTIKDTVSSYGF